MSKPIDEKVLEEVEHAWLNLPEIWKIKTTSPFELRTAEDVEQPHLHLIKIMRDPAYFGFTCKWLLNRTLHPFQLAILREMWIRPFPMLIASRGAGKTFILAVYMLLRAIFQQGSKIVICGSAYRQARYVHEYAEAIWNDAPLLRDFCGESRTNGPRRDVDRCVFRLGESQTIALPLGDGTKIRGQRASVIISDEFSSISLPVYENVIEPFAAVSLDPVLKVKQAAKIKALKQMGLWSDEQAALTGSGLLSNQSVISGSAYYGFNHFCDYWRKWKAIIESRGDQRKLEEIFQGEVPPKFNWKDYCVIRLPYRLLPEGFMDEKNVAKSKATVHMSQFMMEYGAIFSVDSNGFFKRTLIESCVVGKVTNPIEHKSCGEVNFQAVLKGLPTRSYIFGVDPASEKDNFSIVILELWSDHRRIVHCWTTTRKRYKEKMKKGLTTETEFYGYVSRKIRELMRIFPCERICLDSQGGGISVIEALQDGKRLLEGERPIYAVIDPEKPQDTDSLVGDHILEIVQFARADYVTAANHGLRKDFEDKALLFPQFDTAVLGLALEEDKETGRVKSDPEGLDKLYDTLEDCILEIEDLKDELATIQHTQTGQTLRDRWDTPEVKLPGGKKGRLRKDRYSALLMANQGARVYQRTPAEASVQVYGGFAKTLIANKNEKRRKSNWSNPDWYEQKVGDGAGYGRVVVHR